MQLVLAHPPSERRRLMAGAVLAALAGVVSAAAAVAAGEESGLEYAARSVAGMGALLVPGLVAVAVALELLRRRGREFSAALLGLAGVTSFLPQLGIAGARPAFAFTSGLVLGWATPPIVVHLALRRRSPDRVLTASGFAACVLLLGLLPTLAFDPVDSGCGRCATNLLLVHGDAQLQLRLARVGIAVSLGWALVAALALLARIVLATPAGRRRVALVVLPALGLVVSFAVELVLSLHRGYLATDAPGRGLWAAGQVSLLVLALGIASGWLRARQARVRLARDVVELSRGAELGTLRDRLRRALGDPTLEVGYELDVPGRLVDAEGTPLPREPGPATTPLRGANGELLATLRHREGVLDDPAVVEEITRVAGLILNNERLRAQARARLTELRASRARIVEAADTERRRLERDLHDGAQQRLVSLAVALRATGGDSSSPLFDEAQRELATALDELRRIARGIHSAALTDAGLTEAVRALAETATIPVVIGPMPTGRLAPGVEAAAYYAVAEVANDPATTRLEVAAATVGPSLALTVTADGIAGDLARVTDRVSAVGGIVLRIPASVGTRLEVTIPCGS